MLGRHLADGSLRRRFLADETVFGLFVVEMHTPGMGLLLDAAGYDCAIFDMEHGSYTLADLAAMTPGFRGRRCVPLVRRPAMRREFFQASLDPGFAGIVVPMVESAADARACVDLMKYSGARSTPRCARTDPANGCCARRCGGRRHHVAAVDRRVAPLRAAIRHSHDGSRAFPGRAEGGGRPTANVGC